MPGVCTSLSLRLEEAQGQGERVTFFEVCIYFYVSAHSVRMKQVPCLASPLRLRKRKTCRFCWIRPWLLCQARRSAKSYIRKRQGHVSGASKHVTRMYWGCPFRLGLIEGHETFRSASPHSLQVTRLPLSWSEGWARRTSRANSTREGWVRLGQRMSSAKVPTRHGGNRPSAWSGEEEGNLR